MVKRAPHRRPKAVFGTRDGGIACSLEAIAQGRIMDAERDPKEESRLYRELAARISAGADLEAAYRAWLAERLNEIADGKPPKRGRPPLPLAEVRARLNEIAARVVVLEISPSEAAAQCAAERDDAELNAAGDSTWRDLVRQYPDDWRDALGSARIRLQWLHDAEKTRGFNR